MNECRQVILLNESVDRIFSNTAKMIIGLSEMLEITNMNREQKIEFSVDIGLTSEEQLLLSLADDMSAAMTSLNSQNYKEFIDARDRLRSVISEMVKKGKTSEARIAKMKEAIRAA